MSKNSSQKNEPNPDQTIDFSDTIIYNKPFVPLAYLIYTIIEIERHSLHPISRNIIGKCVSYLKNFDCSHEQYQSHCQIKNIQMVVGGIRANLFLVAKYKNSTEKNNGMYPNQIHKYSYDIVIKNTNTEYSKNSHPNNTQPQESQCKIKGQPRNNTASVPFLSLSEIITVYLDEIPVVRFNVVDTVRYSTNFLIKYCISNNIKIIALSGDKMVNVRSVVERLIQMFNSTMHTTQNDERDNTKYKEGEFRQKKPPYNDKVDRKTSIYEQNEESPNMIGTPCFNEGVIHCVSNASSFDKQRLVEKLKSLGTVCYVGDGVNDHMGIEQSDLGVKIGHLGTIGHFQIINQDKIKIRDQKTSRSFNNSELLPESVYESNLCEENEHDLDVDTLFTDLLNLFRSLTDFAPHHNFLLTTSLFYNLVIFLVAFCYILIGKKIPGEWACGGMFFSTFMVLSVFLWLFK